MNFKKKRSRLKLITGCTFFAMLTSTVLLTSFAFENKKASISQNSNITNQSSDNNDISTLSEQLVKAQKSSTYSKQLTPVLSYSDPLKNTQSNIIFVNGEDRPVLEFYYRSEDDSIYARSPNELKIFTNNPSGITSSNFNISARSYNSAPYSLTSSGIVENQYSEYAIKWDVNNETYLKPSLNDINNGTQASSYVIFDSLLKTSTGIKVGSLVNGYVEISIDIQNQEDYNGPSRIKPYEGSNYENYLQPDQNGKLSKKIIFNKVVTDSETGSTEVVTCNAIYNTDIVNNSSYVPDFSGIQSTNKITASEYLKTNLNSLPIKVNNLYNDKSNKSKPQIYGYANDSKGELNIVVIPPYTISNYTSNLSIEATDPIFYTIEGFKTDNSNIPDSNKVYLNSSEINIINASTNKNAIIDDVSKKITTSNSLSAFSNYNFNIANNSLNISPSNEKLNSDKLWLDDIYKNNDLINWDLLDIYANTEQYSFILPFRSGVEFLPISNWFEYLSNSNSVSSIFSTNTKNTSDGDEVSLFEVMYDPYVSFSKFLISDQELNGNSSNYYFANYFPSAIKSGVYDEIKNSLNDSISFSRLSESWKVLVNGISQFIPLPKLKSNSSSANDYYDNLNETYSLILNSDDSNDSKIKHNSFIIGDSIIALGDGSLILMDSNKSDNIKNQPSMIIKNYVLAWLDKKGNQKFALDNFNIFSSKENYEYNKNLGFDNDMFGVTAFSNSSTNLGVVADNSISPSEFIHNESNYKNITLTAYNSPLANIDNSDVTLIADDVNGTVTVEITPFISAYLDESKYGALNLKSEQDLLNLSSNELYNLVLPMLNNSGSKNQTFSFVISGFKKQNISNSNLSNNYFNPTSIYTTSTLLGPDYEANLNSFKEDAERVRFQKWFIANAIQKLNNPIVYFDPNTGTKNPSFFSDTNQINNMYTSFNESQFDNIIQSIALSKSDKYNSYTFKVTFKPYTTYDIYNDINTESWTTEITINTSGDYSSWVSNNYISTGTDEWLKIKDKFTSGNYNPTQYISTFGKILTNNIGQNDKNYLRYYQNLLLNNSYSDGEVQPSSSPQELTVDNMKYALMPTVPIIYNYSNNYGYKFDSNGQFKNIVLDTVQDFSSWSISVANQTDTGIVLKVDPSLWKSNGKFITSNIESFNITFGDMVPENNNKTTTLPQPSTLDAIDSYLTAGELKDAISYQNATYKAYRDRVAALILNLPENNPIGKDIILKVDNDKWNNNKELYTKEGYLDVEVYITNEWYNNSQDPVSITGEQYLGTVTIQKLRKGKITTVNSTVIIPDIDKLVESNIADYSIAQSYWINSYDKSSRGLLEDNFSAKFAYYLADKIFNNPYIDQNEENSSELRNTTHIKWKISQRSPSQDPRQNLFFNNQDGSLTFKARSTFFYGQYYDDNGHLQSSLTNGRQISTDIKISGFKKIENITTGLSGEITIPSLVGSDLNLITDQELKKIAMQHIISNYPKFDSYPLLGDVSDDDSIIEISNVNKEFNKGSITFKYTLNRFVTEQFKNEDNQSINMIVDKTNDLIKTFFEQNNTESISNTITITGFSTIYGPTSLDAAGATELSFANMIATSQMRAQGIQLNVYYGAEKDLISKIINTLLTNNLIQNMPEDITSSDIKVSIISVDNISGIITIKVQMSKYYKLVDGKITLVENGFGEIDGSTVIGGFKTIPGETSIKQDVLDNGIILSGISQYTSDELVKPANYTILKQAIYRSINQIFDNLPSTSNSNPNANNPGFSIDNLLDSSLATAVADGSNIKITLSIDRHFSNDTNYNTITYQENAKPYQEIVLKGLGDFATTIDTEVYLDANDSPLISLLPHNVFNNKQYDAAIRKVIFEKAIKGKIVDGTTPNNLTISSYNTYSNLDGTLNITVSLNKYYSPGQGVVENGSLTQTITIYGFRTAKPTTITENYNGSNNNSINTKYPYEFSENEIKSLLFNTLIFNTPDDFSLSNISIKTNSIRYDNLNGILSFVPILNNYFDENGNLSNSSKEFSRVYISGFLKVKSSTTILDSYIVEGWSKSLAIAFLDYSTQSQIQANDRLNNLVLENMIINAPANLDKQDISISNIVVNNSQGQSKGITFEISLKKYIDSDGNLVTSTPLTKNVYIGGFANVYETNIANTLNISGYSNTGPKQFLKDNSNSTKILNDLIYDNIQNKWTQDQHEGLNDGAFANNSQYFRIANIKANNLEGTISLDLGLYRYIDQNGTYHLINPGQQPKIIKVTITGFNQVDSSEIITSYKISNMGEVLASQWKDPGVNLDLNQIVYDNLLINKLSERTGSGENFEIKYITKPTDLTISNIEANNNEGTLTFNVRWTNNFYDYTGTSITNSQVNECPTENVTISGFKQLNASTTVNSFIDIDSHYNTMTPEQFALLPSSPSSVNNKEFIQELIYKNLNNIPNQIISMNNSTGAITSECPLIKKSDVSIINQIMSDGLSYYGVVNNITGTLTISFEIPKYYDSNGNLITSSNPLKLTTTIRGFKKLDQDQLQTTIASTIDLSSDEVKNQIQNLACASYSQLTSKEFQPSEITKQLLIATNSIQGWKVLTKNDYNEYTPSELLEIYNKIQIDKVSYEDGLATISVRLLGGTINPDDGIASESWSKTYNVIIKGFKVIKPTYINTSLDLSNKQSPDLNNYNENTSYSNINVWNLVASDIDNIVQSELDNIVENQTSSIQKIAEASNISLSDFSKYIKTEIIERSGLNGTIKIRISLSSYYNSQGDLVQNEISNASANIYSSELILFGFATNKVTQISSNIKISDTRSPNEFYEVPGRIANLIEQNKDSVFTNLPTDFNFSSQMIITPINFSNIEGTITFKVTLTHFFNDLGEEINGNGILEQVVTLTGLKQTSETSVKNKIDISDELNIQGDLVNINSTSFINILKTAIVSYQNNDSTSLNKLIFNNLPDSNKISLNDFDIQFIQNQIDFSSGTANAILTLNKYYNELGILVTDIPKSFNVTFTGFNKVGSETKASNQPVDVSDTILSGYNLSQKTLDANLDTIIFNNLNNNLLKQMLINLPSNASVDDVTNIEIIKDDDSYPINEKAGSLWIDISITNSFIKQNNSIIQSFNENKFRVQLTGFAKIDVTSVNSSYDVSNTSLSSLTVNDLFGDNDGKLNDGISTIESVLNIDSVKKQVLINPVYPDGQANANQINTLIKIEEIVDRNGPDGTIDIKVKLNNYYYDDNGVINISQSWSNQDYQIKLTGLKKLALTNMNDTLSFPLNNKSDVLASEFASDLSSIQSELNKIKQLMFIGDGWSTINIIDVVNPDINSLQEYESSNSKRLAYVNDLTGEIKIKFIYSGGYNNKGLVDNTNKLSKTVTLSGFKYESASSWNSSAKVESITYAGTQMDKLVVTDPSFSTLEIDSWDGTFSSNKNLNEIIKEKINENSLITIESQTSNWNKNNAKGIATKLVTINGWKNATTNANVSNKNYNLTSNSVLVEQSQKTILLEVSGFNKVDLNKTQTSLMLLIGISCGLVGLIIIALLSLAFYKRRFH